MTQSTDRQIIRAEVLDPDDGESGVIEVMSGKVLARFATLRCAKAELEKQPQMYAARAEALKENARP